MERVVAAVRSRRPVVLPFDTVYGLAAEPHHDESARALYRLKGRAETQPSALVVADVERLLVLVPELRGRAERLVRALLPGPLTLVLPNPARRFRWITGANQDAIGVRVPELAGTVRAVLERVGAVVATSANKPGGADPARLADVPQELRAGAAAVLDGGVLPGTASTVLDLTGEEPVVLREGAFPADEALARAATSRA